MGGFLTGNECFNTLMSFVEKNISKLPEDLPPEWVQVIIKYSLGLSEETYDRRRWKRLLNYLLSAADHSVESFEMEAGSIFVIRFAQNQEFIVRHPFDADCWIWYDAPVTGGGKIHLEAGLILFTESEIFMDETSIYLNPVDDLAFQKKHLLMLEMSNEFVSGYSLIIKLDDLETYCIKY